jgi:hypothetical protein
MTDVSLYKQTMNDEELAIACILHVAEKEGLDPVEVLWGIVPLANRQAVCDGLNHEHTKKEKRPRRE